MAWRRIVLSFIALLAVVGLQHFIAEPSLSASGTIYHNGAIAASSVVKSDTRDGFQIAKDMILKPEKFLNYNSLSPKEKTIYNNIAFFGGIFGIISHVFFCICMMQIGYKLKIPYIWLVWVPIPIFQIWATFRCAGISLWWLTLVFILPFVNLYLWLISLFLLAIAPFFTTPARLAKSPLLGLLAFLPIIGFFLYYGLIAFT
ncbi:hypothetical protein PseudUWO310_02150 [Pseudanabaena sp. UWO310]|nr:hypothetical protein PseudUWO310_02150 [Pseudanabaena sp. UWO310]